jgi:chemotaxis-related protein WspD
MNDRAVTNSLPLAVDGQPCWQRIGVWGDRSCPELARVTHCHNCPVFAAAGRKFLDAPSPPEYLDEWTKRLGIPEDDEVGDELSILMFRLGDEWLALNISVLVEVTQPRVPHRIPHRGGLLSGMVNIRGELHLCVRLDLLLGVAPSEKSSTKDNQRMVVIRRELEGWVFAADEVDQVYRLPAQSLLPAAPTLARSSNKLNRGVFVMANRSVGLLDDAKLFQALRERTR